jgi:hypothetical protein
MQSSSALVIGALILAMWGFHHEHF